MDNFISLSLSLKYNNLRITMYYKRIIDKYLSEWASRETRKPIILRGARQVGKYSAVRHEAMPSVLLRLPVFSCLQLSKS